MKIFCLLLCTVACSLQAVELKNQTFKADLIPEKGVYIRELLLPGGIPAGNFGCLRIYNSPSSAVDSLKKQTGKVTLSAPGKAAFEIRGQKDRLKDLIFSGSYTFPAGRPEYIHAISVRNGKKKNADAGLTVQNFTWTNGKNTRWFFPHRIGIYSVSTPLKGGEMWLYNPAEPWCGYVSASGHAIVMIQQEKPECFYMWKSRSGKPTLEWRYARRTIQPGRTFSTSYKVMYFTGLKNISGAAENIAGSLSGSKAEIVSTAAGKISYRYICGSRIVREGVLNFITPGKLTVDLKNTSGQLQLFRGRKLLTTLRREYRAPELPAAVPEYVSSDLWFGYPRWNFKVNSCNAWVVSPFKKIKGNPWVWCMEFPTAFIERCAALDLLKAGYYHCYVKVGNTYGSPEAQKTFRKYYDLLRRLGLASKGVLIGISRGGLYAYRFAAENPEKTALIYGDAPVCDFKSWPAGFGKGSGSKRDWKRLKQYYNFSSDEEAKRWKGNPVDNLAPLAGAGIPIIHVVGSSDRVVPPAENTDIVEKRYKAMGGKIKVIRRPGAGHHPHGLDDPSPVVEFILKHSRQQPDGSL